MLLYLLGYQWLQHRLNTVFEYLYRYFHLLASVADELIAIPQRKLEVSGIVAAGVFTQDICIAITVADQFVDKPEFLHVTVEGLTNR